MLSSTTLLVSCPFCDAEAARPCVNPLTGCDLGFPHLERTRAAA